MDIKKAMVQSFLVIMLPLVFADLTLAAIYKSVDKEGNIIYTDSRPADQPSEQVKLRPITPMSPVTINRSAISSPGEEKENKKIYSRLEITAPAHGTTLRNQDKFTVKVAVEPEVLVGHKLRLLLDGHRVGESKGKQSFDLTNVERGTHTLTVEIIDSRNKVVKSSGSTVHVHRNIYRPDVSINPP